VSTWPNSPMWFAILVLVAAGPVAADDSSVSPADLRRAQALAFNCFTCHGPDGGGPGAMKSLAELSAREIREKLKAFARDENDPTIMNRIARGYTAEEIDLIAEYIASLE